MKNLSRTAAVVVALFAGAGFGSTATGCFALWLGVAHADGDSYTTVTVPCDLTTERAVLEYPGLSDAEIAARVTTFVRGDQETATYQDAGYTSTGFVEAPHVANGVAFVYCGPGIGCPSGDCGPLTSVDFTIR